MLPYSLTFLIVCPSYGIKHFVITCTCFVSANHLVWDWKCSAEKRTGQVVCSLNLEWRKQKGFTKLIWIADVWVYECVLVRAMECACAVTSQHSLLILSVHQIPQYIGRDDRQLLLNSRLSNLGLTLILRLKNLLAILWAIMI